MFSVISGAALKQIYFCHGLPGSALDAELLSQANPDCDLHPLPYLEYSPEHMASALAETGASGVHLVGFSIGSMVAAHIAAERPDLVSRLTLISPAAPLQLGDFLPAMAGKPVFTLAQRRPWALAALTAVQGLIARVSAGAMTKMLFADACASEQALLRNPAFGAAMKSAFSNSFVDHRQNYLAYLQTYVSDWSPILDQIKCPVDLWHGSADTWSPPEMSLALQSRLADCRLHMISDAGHYSTMAHVNLAAAVELQAAAGA